MSTSLKFDEEIVTSCRLCILNLSDITWNFWLSPFLKSLSYKHHFMCHIQAYITYT